MGNVGLRHDVTSDAKSPSRMYIRIDIDNDNAFDNRGVSYPPLSKCIHCTYGLLLIITVEGSSVQTALHPRAAASP